MTAEERIVQLETELAREQAKNALLQAELEAQRAEMTRVRTENAQLRQQLD